MLGSWDLKEKLAIKYDSKSWHVTSFVGMHMRSMEVRMAAAVRCLVEIQLAEVGS